MSLPTNLSDAELLQALNDRQSRTNAYLYYGIQVQPRITHVDQANCEMRCEILVTENDIGASGTLDEGWLGTVTDNTTAIIIGVMGERGRASVSTAISVQGVMPVHPNTLVEMCCKLTNRGGIQPHATAVFRDKMKPETVYAVGSHTKFYKNNLVVTQPKI
ncbi:hypothetical protein EC988_010149 [Linderina pennispora]|nr:hypothetical protein EC988_010149 [Linderina pennispora]